MNSEQFCYWAQGFFEMTDAKTLNEAQTAMLKEHLQLVFRKVTHKLNGEPYVVPVPFEGKTTLLHEFPKKDTYYCNHTGPFQSILTTGIDQKMSEFDKISTGWYYDGYGWTRDNLKYPFGIVSNDSPDKYKFEYKGGYPVLSC